MADIFISYASKDRVQAERLAKALRQEGLTVWWDRDSLRSGRSFNKTIEKALEEAAYVVVLWTKTSAVSKYVESEAYHAWEHDKLQSVRLDDSLRLPLPFNTMHAHSLASWNGDANFSNFQRLVSDLKDDLDNEPSPRAAVFNQPAPRARGNEAPAPESSDKSNRSFVFLAIVGIFILFLLLSMVR